MTASRTPSPELDTVGNIAQISEAQIRITSATHPYELAVRAPGVWIGRGSGQEHLTAIRSPVLTGPGSCGAFLILEDGIPTRPAGFCNVNQLFEVLGELATNVEVIRGPANALYGSNGLHGTINTLLPAPGANDTEVLRLGLTGGPNNYLRGRAEWNSEPGKNAFSAGAIVESDDGYRDESGHNQAKLYAKSLHELAGGTLGFGLSATWLDQETAGFITGQDSYKDKNTRFRNENPEAFRDAGSLRLYTSWQPEAAGPWQSEYRGFLRYSEMEFLQHFLPTKPLEKNGQASAGGTYVARRDTQGGARVTLGVDAEIARGYLEEDQDPQYNKSFLPDRPEGLHYDYAANSYMLGSFASLQLPITDRLELQAGLRAEYMLYDYDNRMIDGNTREDGLPCDDPDNEFPPDGCLYSRPPDRSDNFFNLSPNFGALYRFTDSTVGFVNLVSGFRAPQAAELYRLQAQQRVSDIDSEKLDSIEAGVRRQGNSLSFETVAFYMRKRNFIFRDAAQVNVSDGKTRHYGIEANISWRILPPLYASFVGSYARQTYDFDRDAALGEVIRAGNEIDTAPQVLASARLGYEYRLGVAEIEWVHQDPYFLDAANTARYEGHDLLNLRLVLEPAEAISLALRINNLTDEVYADRADLLSSIDPPSYRYFPGREREVYLEFVWQTGGN